jgi:carboxypeptidase Taq
MSDKTKVADTTDTGTTDIAVGKQDALAELKARLATLTDLEGASSLLGWDQNTYMPPGGAEARAQQLATLGKLSHELLTEARVGKLLKELGGAGFAEDSDEAALLRVTQRDFDRATKFPADFVESFTRLRSEGQQVWARARQDSDFAGFAPTLERLLDYSLRAADYLGYEDHPYDALHDLFEPGSKVGAVKEVFAELRDATVALLQVLKEAGREIDATPLHGHFARDVQEKFGKRIVSDFGYSFEHGRLDPTVHPFASSSSKYDVRITTRYDETFLSQALFGTMHEAGHGMYEQYVDSSYDRGPLGGGASLGVHESQSRLWENLVGRSHGFWSHYYPYAQELFPDLGGVSLADFYAAINRVKPSFIRVEADEVTYNLHIMVRFELELALLEGSLKVKDLPEAWNGKYEDYLGVTPPNDALGCLQDIHWSFGAVGYFPTYTLGNIMSVQFFEAAKRAHPELADEIAQGNFETLLSWLRENIYRHGSKYEPADLLRRVTGSGLDAGPYIAYLSSKFKALYGVD